jgi:hypothetical protein
MQRLQAELAKADELRRPLVQKDIGALDAFKAVR